MGARNGCGDVKEAAQASESSIRLFLFRLFADEIRGCRVIVENDFGNRTVENIP
jgi:hypothetical protein